MRRRRHPAAGHAARSSAFKAAEVRRPPAMRWSLGELLASVLALGRPRLNRRAAAGRGAFHLTRRVHEPHAPAELAFLGERRPPPTSSISNSLLWTMAPRSLETPAFGEASPWCCWGGQFSKARWPGSGRCISKLLQLAMRSSWVSASCWLATAEAPAQTTPPLALKASLHSRLGTDLSRRRPSAHVLQTSHPLGPRAARTSHRLNGHKYSSRGTTSNIAKLPEPTVTPNTIRRI